MEPISRGLTVNSSGTFGLMAIVAVTLFAPDDGEFGDGRNASDFQNLN